MFYLHSHVVHYRPIYPTKHALSSGVIKDGRLSSFMLTHEAGILSSIMLTHEAGMETQYGTYNLRVLLTGLVGSAQVRKKVKHDHLC